MLHPLFGNNYRRSPGTNGKPGWGGRVFELPDMIGKGGFRSKRASVEHSRLMLLWLGTEVSPGDREQLRSTAFLSPPPHLHSTLWGGGVLELVPSGTSPKFKASLGNKLVFSNPQGSFWVPGKEVRTRLPCPVHPVFPFPIRGAWHEQQVAVLMLLCPPMSGQWTFQPQYYLPLPVPVLL